jgi:hypothetical protein
MSGISIVSTITQLNMGTWNLRGIGLMQLFTAGSNKAFTRRIGAVRSMGSWDSMIWIRLLLWNKEVSGHYTFVREVKVCIACILDGVFAESGNLLHRKCLIPYPWKVG